MTADSLVRARSRTPTPTPSTTITNSDTPPKGLVHHVPPHKAPDPSDTRAIEPAAGHDEAHAANISEPQTSALTLASSSLTPISIPPTHNQHTPQWFPSDG
eukprot:scaffold33847_cov129-Isochrysis_galbana.AAC.1